MLHYTMQELKQKVDTHHTCNIIKQYEIDLDDWGLEGRNHGEIR